jgi:hypothetical protein
MTELVIYLSSIAFTLVVLAARSVFTAMREPEAVPARARAQQRVDEARFRRMP